MAFAMEDDAGATCSVVVLLRSPVRSAPRGRPIPIEIEVRNESAQELLLVGVVDGSEHGIRYPHYRPSVTRDDTLVAQPAAPEDPLVGPLRRSDFRRLGPGQGFDPTRAEGGAAYLPLATFATFSPVEPGTYRYTLVLSTDSGRSEDWLGRFGQDSERDAVLGLVARVPRLTVSSDALEVEVT